MNIPVSIRIFYAVSVTVMCFLSTISSVSGQLPPLKWHKRYTAPSPPTVAYGNGRFIAPLGDGTILSSTDAVSWTRYFIGESIGSPRFYLGNFISGNRISPDGFIWNPTSPANLYPSRMALGTRGILGIRGSNTLLTSLDGTSWTQYTGYTPSSWVFTDIAFGGGMFVLIAHDFFHNFILTSPDGVVWTFQFYEKSPSLAAIAYANERFVVSASGGTNLVSIDATNWTAVANTRPVFKAVNEVFVSTYSATAATPGFHFSTNGVDWISQPIDEENVMQIQDIAFGQGTFVAVCANLRVQAPAEIWQSDPVQPVQPHPPAGIALSAYPGLTLSGSAGVRYTVEYKEGNVADAAWMVLTNVLLSSPSTLIFDSSPIGVKPRFYRVLSE